MKFSVEEACRSTCWKPASITGLEVSFRTALIDDRLEMHAIVSPAALLMIPDSDPNNPNRRPAIQSTTRGNWVGEAQRHEAGPSPRRLPLPSVLIRS
jgi:hypothetical protein